MNEIIINKEYRLYVLEGHETCCSDDPRLPYGSHPLAGGGMSSPQSSSMTIPHHIVVEKDACVNVVLLVMPGVSVDLKFDVELVGEGAQANIYGAYICAGHEKEKISVDMTPEAVVQDLAAFRFGQVGGGQQPDEIRLGAEGLLQCGQLLQNAGA